MDMVIEFTKVWNNRDGSYSEKKYYLNPSVGSFEGIEACNVNNKGVEVSCTKVFYASRFIIVLGNPETFLDKCREANVAYNIILEMQRSGLTIKEFIKQNERLNGVEFH